MEPEPEQKVVEQPSHQLLYRYPIEEREDDNLMAENNQEQVEPPHSHSNTFRSN